VLPFVVIADRPVLTWAIVVSCAVVLCWALVLPRTTRMGYAPARVLAWLVLALPVGALGARALAGLVALALGQNASGLALLRNGMTVLGSIVACLVFTVLFVRVAFREWPLRLLDAAAFTFPLAVACGRVGCLFNGCCFGKLAPADAPAWLTLATAAMAKGTHAADRFAASAGANARIWNLPLFLVAAALATLSAAEWLYRRRGQLRLPDGTVFLITLALDGALRFCVEFLREEPRLGGGPFHPWQLLALGFALAASLGAAVLAQVARQRPAACAVQPRP
jgi:phosphatidylglycerol:prolipoprotein diacylglycerol transferase